MEAIDNSGLQILSKIIIENIRTTTDFYLIHIKSSHYEKE